MSRKQAFIDYVVDVCNNPKKGYSQPKRWDPDSYDCSSLMYRAGYHAGYNLPKSGTRYTGTILEHFRAAGWTAVPFDGVYSDCSPGDILLNVANHVEVFVAPGMLGGAHIDEHGGVVGCCEGDQTGNEISVGPVYTPSFGWDFVLIPPTEEGEDQNAPAITPSTPTGVTLPMPRYRVWTKENGWLEWLTGLRCEDNCGDTYAGIPGNWIYDVEIDTSSLGEGGWWMLTLADGTELPRNTRNEKREQPITGITVYYATPNPAETGYYEAVYRVGVAGGDYLKWEHDDDDDGAGGAGPIDRFQLTIEKM